ncbi:PepSY domain-containing protein [Paenibacillus sp. 2TAB23]|uniref:PepSY domain-containing protein n=1 Tax=Paenibacillus sp. 2TAB23 TaxID=3233004 RepID=UPI003F987102
MHNRKWRISVAAAVIAIGVILAWATFIALSRADRSHGLTLAAAEEEVLGHYEGEIVGSKEQGEGYVIQLQSTQGLYELTVEPTGITGIRSLERFGSSDPGASPGTASPVPTDSEVVSDEPSQNPSEFPSGKPAASPAETQLPESTPKPTVPATTVKPTTMPTIIISEQRASELALKKIPGKVKDIDKENEGGKWYFFVEIETNDGREADVQLNAASGAVVSVTWDDESDED